MPTPNDPATPPPMNTPQTKLRTAALTAGLLLSLSSAGCALLAKYERSVHVISADVGKAGAMVAYIRHDQESYDCGFDCHETSYSRSSLERVWLAPGAEPVQETVLELTDHQAGGATAVSVAGDTRWQLYTYTTFTEVEFPQKEKASYLARVVNNRQSTGVDTTGCYGDIQGLDDGTAVVAMREPGGELTLIHLSSSAQVLARTTLAGMAHDPQVDACRATFDNVLVAAEGQQIAVAAMVQSDDDNVALYLGQPNGVGTVVTQYMTDSSPLALTLRGGKPRVLGSYYGKVRLKDDEQDRLWFELEATGCEAAAFDEEGRAAFLGVNDREVALDRELASGEAQHIPLGPGFYSHFEQCAVASSGGKLHLWWTEYDWSASESVLHYFTAQGAQTQPVLEGFLLTPDDLRDRTLR